MTSLENPSMSKSDDLKSDQPIAKQIALAEKAALSDQWDSAEQDLTTLQKSCTTKPDQIRIELDLAALEARNGRLDSARSRLRAILATSPDHAPAQENLQLIEDELQRQSHMSADTPANHEDNNQSEDETETPSRRKVAILSLLFNWPSTGGGTIHTAETGAFLQRDGYEVRHIYARYPGWQVGEVAEPLEHPCEALEFDDTSWNADTIRQRFRNAVDAFSPDFVIVTDSWNTKPLLAEAVYGYPYALRLAALECLCPLNNVRLLYDQEVGWQSCPRQQLATPKLCRECVHQLDKHSGGLHRADRQLAGFEHVNYPSRLRQAFAEAECVLVVNPLIAAMVGPFAKRVDVVPSGFDAARFPWPDKKVERPDATQRKRLLFAGLVNEPMKGFRVLHDACARLWSERKDFELLATADPPGQVDEFTQFIGWQSQEDLPTCIQDADLLVFPTVAEEALGRSAVEAMAVGRPVIASRIGGLPFTVQDGATGLLFEPNDSVDLADKLQRLLDDDALRLRLGQAGRRRFEEHFVWETIIARHYRPLIGEPNLVDHSLR